MAAKMRPKESRQEAKILAIATLPRSGLVQPAVAADTLCSLRSLRVRLMRQPLGELQGRRK